MLPRAIARGRGRPPCHVDRSAGEPANGGTWAIGIGARILLFQAIIAAAVLVMAGVVYVAIRSADYYVSRTVWTNQQLRAISELAVAANR